jgi:DNA-binding transcriptional LysR family regulator
MVNLEWYRSFVEIYRSGTVSGAARILHLTQPAVSQHLAALEAALGQQLFQRLPRKMLPTPEGQRLYTQVVASIEQLTTISTRSLAVNSPQILRLGTPPEFFADRLLPQLSPAEPWLYRIQFGLAPDLIAQLLAEQLDVVIATQRIARSDLEYKLITEENFWLVAPPNTIVPISPEILQADLTLLEEWLRGQPLIAYGEDLPIIRRFWRVVFGRRLDLVPQLVLPDLRAIRQAIADGFGFSVLPDYLCEAMVKSQVLKLILKPTNAVTNQIWLAYRKSDRRSSQVILLLDLLQLS